MEKIFGVRIDDLTTRDFLGKVDEFGRSGRSHQIVTVNSEFLVTSLFDTDFRRALFLSDLNTADSIGILWAAKYLSLKLPEGVASAFAAALWQFFVTAFSVVFFPRWIRTAIHQKNSGTDLIWSIAGQADRRGYSMFLLGGFGDVADKTAAKLKQRYPNLKIAGVYSGSPTEEGIVERVNKTGADILLVAFGPVRQELWISKNLKKLTASVCMGLGGTFDYIAGNKALAPDFLRYMGLEWVWRLITQPHRLFRMIRAVPVFMYWVFQEKMLSKKPYRKSVGFCVLNERDEVLICRRKFDRTEDNAEHWQLPHGGVEKNESEEASSKRELFEEIGLKEYDVIGHFKNIFQYDWSLYWARFYGCKYRGQALSLLALKIKPGQKIVVDQREFDAFRWVKLEDLLSSVHPAQLPFTKVVLEKLKTSVKNNS